jgi:very-short-patch-repair endonuclease
MANQTARRLRKSMTPQEAKLWVFLRELRGQGLHFRRQVPIENFIVDFACLRHHLVIEVDGSGHSYYRQASRDTERDLRLGELGFRVLRFSNEDVGRGIEQVINAVLARVRP